MADTDQQQQGDVIDFRPAAGEPVVPAQPPPPPSPPTQAPAPLQTPPPQTPPQQAGGVDFTPALGPGVSGSWPGTQEQKSVGAFLGNVLTSGANFLGNVTRAVTHFPQTAEGLTDILKGELRYAGRMAGMDLPRDESDQAGYAMGKYLVERFGGVDRAWNSLYHDPVGVFADASAAFSGLGAAADIAGATRAAEVLTTAGKVANPLYVPSKIVSGTLGSLIRKPAPAPAAQSAQAAQDAIRQRAYEISQIRTSGDPMSDWLMAEKEIRNPQPAAAASPPSGTNAQTILGVLKSAARSPGGAGLAVSGAAEILTHHLMGSLGAGLTIGALKFFLNSDTGQQMLSRIGPGSTPAAVAAVARDMAPALNAFSRAYQSSMAQKSVFDYAKGGAVNPELARIQRERLRLPGVLETLQKSKQHVARQKEN